MEILMRHAIAILLITGFTISGKAVSADTDHLNSLLLKNNCLACHTIDKRKYGPILRDISGKYSGDTTASDKLVAKIKAGGTGVWGEDVMPPQPQVSDVEAKQIVQLILSLQPK
jgi:cytochrome c